MDKNKKYFIATAAHCIGLLYIVSVIIPNTISLCSAATLGSFFLHLLFITFLAVLLILQIILLRSAYLTRIQPYTHPTKTITYIVSMLIFTVSTLHLLRLLALQWNLPPTKESIFFLLLSIFSSITNGVLTCTYIKEIEK